MIGLVSPPRIQRYESLYDPDKNAPLPTGTGNHPNPPTPSDLPQPSQRETHSSAQLWAAFDAIPPFPPWKPRKKQG
jgi:hypothetical protein